jgi:hypothetical protein
VLGAYVLNLPANIDIQYVSVDAKHVWACACVRGVWDEIQH